ncbi:MAG: hypothetical protein JNM99_09060 [Verrucomicrobiaceae bacterium]|nr:hypothetical protein [Verrucomicrobiaceae bacterium]
MKKGVLCVLALMTATLAGADLKLRDGTVYRNTKILRSDGTVVELFIAGFGVKKVNFSQLLPEDQAKVTAQAKADAEAAAAEARQREINRKESEAKVAARMAGVKVIALKSKKGKTYEGITSWEWEKNNAGVKINYPGGIAHLMVDDLDDASQKLLRETPPK